MEWMGGTLDRCAIFSVYQIFLDLFQLYPLHFYHLPVSASKVFTMACSSKTH